MDTLPQTLTIRTKSAGVKIRAGLVLGSAREWAEHTIECTVDGFKKLLALAQEPGVQVHGKDEEGNWLPLPGADDIKAGIRNLETAQDASGAQAAINTMLPTAEPTLEREPTDTRPPRSVGGEGTEEDRTQTLDGAQNAAPSEGQESTPAPDAPAAEAEDEAKAEPEA